MVLAYLPRYIADASALVAAIGIALRALVALITGRLAGMAPPDEGGVWTRPRVRMAAIVALLVAAGIALLGFVLPAEPPGGLHNHWGGTSDRVAFGIWVAFMAAITAYGLWRDRRT